VRKRLNDVIAGSISLREGELICCIFVAWRASRKYSYTVLNLEIRWKFPFEIMKADLHLART